MYLKEGQKLKNGVQNLENNRSPNSQTIEIPAERLPLVGDGVGDRLPPDGSEWDDLVQGMKERSQERLESSEGIAGGDISTTDKHLGVDEQRDCGEISQETEEGSKNLENLEVFDEILGEGEFGIVYKGRYSGKDGNITDVAVKKLKGRYTNRNVYLLYLKYSGDLKTDFSFSKLCTILIFYHFTFLGKNP